MRRACADGVFAAEGRRGYGRPPVERGDERADDDPWILLRHGRRGGAHGRFDRPSGAGYGYAGRRGAVEDTCHAGGSLGRHAGDSRRGAGRHVDTLPADERTLCGDARFAAVRGAERHGARCGGAARPPGRAAGAAGVGGGALRADGAFCRAICAGQSLRRGDGGFEYDPCVDRVPARERRRARLCDGFDRRSAGRRERPREQPDAAAGQQCRLVEGHSRNAAAAGQPAHGGRGAPRLARTQFHAHRRRGRASARNIGPGAGRAEQTGDAADIYDELQRR